MNLRKFFTAIAVLSCTIGSMSAQYAQTYKRVKTISDSICNLYAPDSRTEIFSCNHTFAGSDSTTFTLTGLTTSKMGHEALIQAYAKSGFTVNDNVQLLPDKNELGERIWGIVRNSVCNLRKGADYDAENVTQAQMGMPVRVLHNEDGWLLIQTPDRYIGFVNSSAIKRITRSDMEQWNASQKVVITSLWGQAFEKPNMKSQPLCDVIGGNRVKLLGTRGKFFYVELPDGRKGYISKQVGKEESKWRANLSMKAEDILKTAFSLYGIPYLWSGLSPKGVDCSGFVRTTLLMHDIIIPRDCSQMCVKGQRIEIGDFSNLLPGDLLFFGSRNKTTGKERVSHVGFYTGNKHFIHSLGNVHEGSFNPADDIYDEYNLGRLLFATRVLPFINREDGLNTTDKNPFYSDKLNF